MRAWWPWRTRPTWLAVRETLSPEAEITFGFDREQEQVVRNVCVAASLKWPPRYDSFVFLTYDIFLSQVARFMTISSRLFVVHSGNEEAARVVSYRIIFVGV